MVTMNKNILIGIGVVVAIAAGLLLYTNMPKDNSGSGSEQAQDAGSGQTTISGTLQDLFARGTSMQCDFSYADEQGASAEGTVYVSGDKMRGMFTSSVDGTAYTSSMIQDGTYSYVWSEDQKQGTKFKVDPAELEAAQEELKTQQESPDLQNMQVDYSCRPWTPDSSMFTPPSDVEFIDMTAAMESIPDMQDSGVQDSMDSQEMPTQEDRCAACQSVPAGDARDACLQGLGCN